MKRANGLYISPTEFVSFGEMDMTSMTSQIATRNRRGGRLIAAAWPCRRGGAT